MTVCNMTIEAGARAGLIAPDEKTFSYLKGKTMSPKGENWTKAVEFWKTLYSDKDCKFDKEINIDGKQIPQHFTLEDGVNYIPPVIEKDELTKCLNIISSLQKTNLYNDIDWIIRLFEKAIFLSNTKKDKIAIINTLDEVISSNEKFTSSDYSKIVERLN